jgi:hypothetical protein
MENPAHTLWMVIVRQALVAQGDKQPIVFSIKGHASVFYT